MERSKKILAVKFSVLEGVFWCIFAAYAAYISAFALHRGISQTRVSIMVAIYMLSAFIGQFVWGSVSDLLKTNKKVFLLGITGAFLLYFAMYYFKNPVIFTFFYALLGFMLGPMGSILDSWLLKSLDFDSAVYGRARGIGSAAYAVCILIMGRLISKFGYIAMPIGAAISILITFGVAMSMADAPVEENPLKAKISLKDIALILKIPIYLILLGILFFVGLSVAPVNNLKIMVLQSVGGDVYTQGLDSFFGCLAQFLVFFFAGYFRRIPVKVRLLSCSLLIFLSLILDYTARGVVPIIMATVISFSCYSILIPVAREIVAANIDIAYQTTANGLVDAFYGSLSGMVSLLYAGSLVQHFGVPFMVGISLGIILIPLAITLVLIFRKGKTLKGFR